MATLAASPGEVGEAHAVRRDEDQRAPDHPRLLAFPEGDYLKVVLCRATR